MAYNQATAEANKAAKAAAEVSSVQALTDALLAALRGAAQPDVPPALEIVTVGETSDPKLDRLIFCPDCLSKDGPSWGKHQMYWLAADPERPGRIKRFSYDVAHPQVPKTISYDQISVRAGLDADPPTHGLQCLQCGATLHKAA